MHRKDWKKSESNDKSIAFNILHLPYNTEKIRHEYKSKHNINCQNQLILLMVTDGKEWHYLAVEKLSALLRRITSNHNGDFYCINCLHSFRKKNELKNHKNVCKNHDYCHIEMPKENNKILKHKHGEKSTTASFVILC